jgi:hypothetical protein
MGIAPPQYFDCEIAEVAAMLGMNDEPDDESDDGAGGSVEMVDPLQFRVGG